MKIDKGKETGLRKYKILMATMHMPKFHTKDWAILNCHSEKESNWYDVGIDFHR